MEKWMTGKFITGAQCTGNFTDTVHPGDEVSEEIYHEMLNVLPAIFLDNSHFSGFQMGEPYCHRINEKNGKLTPCYLTFVNMGRHYYYTGINFCGQAFPELEIKGED